MQKFNIALDGPSGAGKSSVADLLAAKYDMKHLDTGAMYRALSWLLSGLGIRPDDEAGLEKALESVRIEMPEDGRVIINGQDVTSLIRTPEVSMLASRYASAALIRKKMVELQQEIAGRKGFIVDGRDICDVVLPDAEVKIYLDASPQARARRRYLQDLEGGKTVDYDQVLSAIMARDEQDKNRSVSPLKISEEAIVVDSSELSLEQTVDAISEIVGRSLKKEGLL